MEALNYKIAAKKFRRFVDHSHASFQEMFHADKFSEILNKQDPAMKYTVEFEDHKHLLLSNHSAILLTKIRIHITLKGHNHKHTH